MTHDHEMYNILCLCLLFICILLSYDYNLQCSTILYYEMYNVLFHCFHSPTYIRSFHGAAITITITIKTLINFFNCESK